jgi:hypothetical protein
MTKEDKSSTGTEFLRINNKMSKLSETRAIAKEAYVFFRSMIDQYHLKMRYNKHPNQIFWLFTEKESPPAVFGLYKFAFLDTRKEPVVLKTPEIKPDYMFSVTCVDHWANNFASFGTMTTGNKAANYQISGPNWLDPPNSDIITKNARAEGDYSTMLLRLEVEHPDDSSDVRYVSELLEQCKLQTLSEFQGKSRCDLLPQPDFPKYDTSLLKTADVFKYVNFFMQFAEIYPTEKKYFDRFAQIGVYPGAPWPPVNVDLSFYEAIGQGVWEASELIHSERQRQVETLTGGWEHICGLRPPLIGDRKVMHDRYLARAGEALSTFEWPNSVEETVYMQAREDDKGKPLDGKCDYKITWSKDEIPKVNPIGCWSITIYTRRGGVVGNDNVISSNSAPTKYTADGGLIVYILSKPPPDDFPDNVNWLVSPDDGEFQVFVRLFWPCQEVLNGLYTPPLPTKVTENIH